VKALKTLVDALSRELDYIPTDPVAKLAEDQGPEEKEREKKKGKKGKKKGKSGKRGKKKRKKKSKEEG
jgi:hypothetical protein